MQCEKSVSLIIAYTLYYSVLWHDRTGKRLLAFSPQIRDLLPFSRKRGTLNPCITRRSGRRKKSVSFAVHISVSWFMFVNSLSSLRSGIIDKRQYRAGYATMLIRFSISLVFVYVTVLSISIFLKAGLFCDAFFLKRLTIIFSRCSASTTKSIMISEL